MIKPRRLPTRPRIAIVSPSSGLPPLYPVIYELGLDNLQSVMGFDIVEMPTARMSEDELYQNPKLRADDINKAFADPQIDGIIVSIGGSDSVRILRYLDIETILRNPKLIMGFSDATTFLSYLNYRGLVTFYGPSVMAGFAQLKHLPSLCTDHIKSLLLNKVFPYSYTPYPQWTNGYMDWKDEKHAGECTEFFNNKNGWTFLQGDQFSEGRLWGGCIEVLEFLKSTNYWPDKDFWYDKILFFETSEEKSSPRQVGYMLRNYGIQGILEKVKGVIFGRPKDYSFQEKEELKRVVLGVLRDEFAIYNIPIVMDMDFGHTDPKLILPLGIRCNLNPLTRAITLLENPFNS